MKSSNDTIENRTRDLPACSAVQFDKLINPNIFPTFAGILFTFNQIQRVSFRYESPFFRKYIKGPFAVSLGFAPTTCMLFCSRHPARAACGSLAAL